MSKTSKAEGGKQSEQSHEKTATRSAAEWARAVARKRQKRAARAICAEAKG